MKFTVKSDAVQDNKVTAHITVDSKDVDRAIKKAYSEMAQKYNFQGFRKGKAPRPVIDSMVGKQYVMGVATENLLSEVEPLVIEELNIVPLGEVSYGENPTLVEQGKDYSVDAVITVRPECELENYDAPEINMPPAEVTDAELEEQLEALLDLQSTFEDAAKTHKVNDKDLTKVQIENIENAEDIAGERMIYADMPGVPAEIVDAIKGMKVGDSKEVEFNRPASDVKAKIKITIEEIKTKKTPKLTEKLAKESFGFDSIDALRDALKIEIEKDKKNSLPSLKENRVIQAIEDRLKLEETPKEYLEQVNKEITQDFLNQLSYQGMTVDSFLAQQGITPQQLVADLQEQAHHHARQSLALDALAAKLKLEALEEDVINEFKNIGMPDVEARYEEFKKNGQLPAIRESIKRSKALQWLTDNAKVTEVDEVAERRAKKPAKKTAAKKTADKKTADKKSDK